MNPKHLSHLLALLLLGLLCACKPGTPRDVLSESKMEEVLYDYHLAQALAKTAQGDSVAITPQGQVMVNGALVLQRDASPTPAYEGGPDYPLTLGEGEGFLLCDNRRTGADSRLFGPLSANQRRGKILVILRRSQL